MSRRTLFVVLLALAAASLTAGIAGQAEAAQPPDPLAGTWYEGGEWWGPWFSRPLAHSPTPEAWGFIETNTGLEGVIPWGMNGCPGGSLLSFPSGDDNGPDIRVLARQADGQYRGEAIVAEELQHPDAWGQDCRLSSTNTFLEKRFPIAVRLFENDTAEVAGLEAVPGSEPNPSTVTVNADGSVLGVPKNFTCVLISRYYEPTGLPPDFCNVLAHPWPSAGYGYGFHNFDMDQEAADVGVGELEVLPQDSMSKTFADWQDDPTGILLGALWPNEPQAYRLARVQRFWEAMRSGVCLGLALSSAWFAEGMSPWDPGAGRSDGAWKAGGPSGTLLPAPSADGTHSYNVQLLQLLAADDATQFATEVEGEKAKQKLAYQQAVGGTEAFELFRSHLEATLNGPMADPLSPSGSDLALVTLEPQAKDTGAHIVVAYGLEVVRNQDEEEVLKVSVWDSNAQGRDSTITVKENGEWSDPDAPLGGHTSFSLSAKTGYLYVQPPYWPGGLHYRPPPHGSAIWVGPDGEVTDAKAADGSIPTALQSVADVGAYGGEALTYGASSGYVDLSGASPTIAVQGADVDMAMTASGPVHVVEDVDAGSISATGASAMLAVGRANVMASSAGAESLAVGQDLGISATADSSGHLRIALEAQGGASPGGTVLYDGVTSPGAQLTISPQEVAAAEERSLASGGSVISVPAPQSAGPRPRQRIPALKCRKGFRKATRHGGERCVWRHRRKHKHGRSPRHHGQPTVH